MVCFTDLCLRDGTNWASVVLMDNARLLVPAHQNPIAFDAKLTWVPLQLCKCAILHCFDVRQRCKISELPWKYALGKLLAIVSGPVHNFRKKNETFWNVHFHYIRNMLLSILQNHWSILLYTEPTLTYFWKRLPYHVTHFNCEKDGEELSPFFHYFAFFQMKYPM